MWVKDILSFKKLYLKNKVEYLEKKIIIWPGFYIYAKLKSMAKSTNKMREMEIY